MVNRIILLALAYYVSGTLSLLLAIPPGFATPVWPAAGIALAGVLLWGYRCLPGVLLGSFFINLLIASNSGAEILHTKPILVALGIACGASLQAAFSAYIVKRAVLIPNPLESSKDVLNILIRGGLAGCLVNSLIGPFVILTAGFITPDLLAASCFTWWVGDTIGVVLVTPVVILLASRSVTSTRKITSTVPVIIIFIVTVLIFNYARNTEQRAGLNKFTRLTMHQGDLIRDRLLVFLELLHSIKQFYAASEFVSHEEFSAFVSRAIQKYEGIQALEWVPRVKHAEIKQYEAEARKNGFADFNITEQTRYGMLGVSERELYYPVYYLQPYKGNERALGYDIGSHPDRLKALEKARDTGQQVATPGIKLVQGDGVRFGFLIFDPIYENGRKISSIHDRRAYLKGFAVGVFNIEKLIGGVLKDTEKRFYHLHIFDKDNEENKNLLYGPATEETLYRHNVEFGFGDRKWVLEFTPTPAYLKDQTGWQAWMVLTGGLLFTSLLQAFLLSLTAGTEVIKRIVHEKTHALTDREERHRAVLENTVEGMITIDSDGIIESFNPAAERIFGYSEREALGKNVSLLMPSPFAEEHDGYLKNYLSTKEKQIIGRVREVIGLHKDGSEFPMDLSVSEINLHGQLLFSGIVRDVSDRKKAEDELVRSNLELERFAYVASHDLQEPLRMISSFTNLILDEYKDKLDDRSSRYMSFINNAATRMQELVRDLLEYSRADQAVTQLEQIECDPLLNTVLEALSGVIAETGAIITHDKMPTVHSNAIRISRLLQNLIGNAIKYQKKGDTPEIHIGVRDDTDQWVFSVSDNGIGIKKEYLDQVFVLFKRLHQKDEYPGTGIGLAICKKIVESIGGQIWVDSEFGKGSTFHFSIPKKSTGKEAA